MCNHESNVPSLVSPQWLCGNSCTWAHDSRIHTASTNETKNAQQAMEGAYYASCIACSPLFDSLVPAMCNRTSCARGHELPQSLYGDNQKGTLLS